jgi:hypothetical protein
VLVPRQWPSTFTTRWREVAHPAGRRAAAGLARRHRHRPAHRLGAGGRRQRRRLRPDAGGHGQRPAGRIGPFRTGWAIIALRTDAPVVPLAIAGTEELYLGRRIASRVLPVTSARALAGLGADDPLPAPDSREELALAKVITERLAALLGPVVEELAPGTVDPPDHPRRLRKRLTWLLLRPGRLDRDG